VPPIVSLRALSPVDLLPQGVVAVRAEVVSFESQGIVGRGYHLEPPMPLRWRHISAGMRVGVMYLHEFDVWS
jgi:hypothetical protein